MRTLRHSAPTECRSPEGHATMPMGPRGRRAADNRAARRRSVAVLSRCSATTTSSPSAQRRPSSASAGNTTSSMACTSGRAANVRSSSISTRGPSPCRAAAASRDARADVGPGAAAPGASSSVSSAWREATASEMRWPSATRAASHSTRSTSSSPYRRWPPSVRVGRSTPYRRSHARSVSTGTPVRRASDPMAIPVVRSDAVLIRRVAPGRRPVG